MSPVEATSDTVSPADVFLGLMVDSKSLLSRKQIAQGIIGWCNSDKPARADALVRGKSDNLMEVFLVDLLGPPILVKGRGRTLFHQPEAVVGAIQELKAKIEERPDKVTMLHPSATLPHSYGITSAGLSALLKRVKPEPGTDL